MGIRINTNVIALNVQRNLRLANQRVQKSMERLSSGLRLNRAADNPADLAVALKLETRIRGLEVNRRNALDGISMTGVAEGALAEVSNILIRMRELAQQASNETLSETQRGHLETEFVALRDEVARIAQTTNFNGQGLIDGTGGTIDIHVAPGSSADSAIQLDFATAADDAGLGLDGLSIGGADGSAARAALDGLDTAANSVSSIRAGLGAQQNRLESTVRTIGNAIENLSAARSRIRDVDIAFESAELVSAQILQQSGIAILSQAVQGPSVALQLLQSISRR